MTRLHLLYSVNLDLKNVEIESSIRYSHSVNLDKDNGIDSGLALNKPFACFRHEHVWKLIKKLFTFHMKQSRR